MADLGYVALFLALVAAGYSIIAYVVGKRGRHYGLLLSAKNGLIAVCGLVSLTVFILLYALVTHDFQFQYVAEYTNRALPIGYLISALWAGNAGSLLFWAWLLSILALIVVLQKRQTGNELVPYAASIMLFTIFFFLVLVLFVDNPLQQLSFVPADGNGLNPLLENPGMFFHPPALLGGFAGFTVPFAFAVAALLMRRPGEEWIPTIRRWTLIAWLLLGIGNILGMWWAYVELGWGGYWAWDPVENASLIPWLIATAFLHSIMMQRRRGMLKVWNMMLIILTFTVCILGTFLTRSGILQSVHAFPESPVMGTLFMIFMGITFFGSLGLLYSRMNDLRSEAEMESLVSRESTFLLNNILLVGAAFITLLGTFFPLISEIFSGTQVTLDAGFFNEVVGPIFLVIVLLAGVCTLIGWRRASAKNLKINFLVPGILTVLLAIVLIITSIHRLAPLIGFTVCGFVLFTILYEWFRVVRARHRTQGEDYFTAFGRLVMANRPRYGGFIVHIGILLMALGIVGSSFYNLERDVTIRQGESMSIGRYSLTLDSVEINDSITNRSTLDATMLISNGGDLIGKLNPQKSIYYLDRPPEERQSVTEVAIRSSAVEDIYIILAGQDSAGYAFKVLINPLVIWIWIGGTLMVLGGLFAFWPGREKLAVPALEARQGKRGGK